MAQPAKMSGMCPECRKGKLVLIRTEHIPGLPKDYVYICNSCGYQIIETEAI